MNTGQGIWIPNNQIGAIINLDTGVPTPSYSLIPYYDWELGCWRYYAM